MKYILVFLLVFLFSPSYSQTYNCKGKLLSDLGTLEGCGDIMYYTKAKFQIWSTTSKKHPHTAVLIMECPGDFNSDDPHFWKKGAIYNITYCKYDKTNKPTHTAYDRDNTIKNSPIFGVIQTAKEDSTKFWW